MSMTFVDARGVYFQGNLPFSTLEAILKNSIYNAALPIGKWNQKNLVVTVTKGAHTGTFYPGYGNYYFDVSLSIYNRDAHCIINNPSNANSSVLSVQ